MTRIDPSDKAMDAVVEYIKKRDGVEWEGEEERKRYADIIATDKEFHDYAFFNYGLYIQYFETTEKLLIRRLRGFSKYSKEELVSIKGSIKKFGSIEEYRLHEGKNKK